MKFIFIQTKFRLRYFVTYPFKFVIQLFTSEDCVYVKGNNFISKKEWQKREDKKDHIAN
jgi:hypothetical protein